MQQKSGETERYIGMGTLYTTMPVVLLWQYKTWRCFSGWSLGRPSTKI